MEEIRKAALHVAHAPLEILPSREPGMREHRFGIWNDLPIRIAIEDLKVISAYPSYEIQEN